MPLLQQSSMGKQVREGSAKWELTLQRTGLDQGRKTPHMFWHSTRVNIFSNKDLFGARK
ncbi:hypothetical protein GBF38_020024, partial [Nibea albiflora]